MIDPKSIATKPTMLRIRPNVEGPSHFFFFATIARIRPTMPKIKLKQGHQQHNTDKIPRIRDAIDNPLGPASAGASASSVL